VKSIVGRCGVLWLSCGFVVGSCGGFVVYTPPAGGGMEKKSLLKIKKFFFKSKKKCHKIIILLSNVSLKSSSIAQNL